MPELDPTMLPDTGETANDVPAPSLQKLRCHRSYAETRFGIYCITRQCTLWDETRRACLDRVSLLAKATYYALPVVEMIPDEQPESEATVKEGGDAPDGEGKGE